MPARLARSMLAPLLFSAVGVCVCAQDNVFRDGLDGNQPAWTVRYLPEFQPPSAKLVKHERRHNELVEGAGSEAFEFQTSRRGQNIQIEYPLPAARQLDELTVSFRVKSNRAGMKPGVRVVFPNQNDPRSGDVLTTIIRGSAYDDPGNWQLVECRTTEKLMQTEIRQLRSVLRTPNIDVRGAYIDQAVFLCDLTPGTTEILVDDLRFGPIVAASIDDDPVSAATPLPAHGVGEKRSGATFRLGRLWVDGRPFVPRVVPDHGEDPAILAGAGINVAWLPDYRSTDRLASLRNGGIRAMATPPGRRNIGQDMDGHGAVGLPPFGADTDEILCWYLGTQIPGSEQKYLIDWKRQIRSADQATLRPLMADVSDNERVFSRHVQMLSVSRHSMGTSFSPQQYNRLLEQKLNIARPGTFLSTWIQTESRPADTQWRNAVGRTPIVIEPEQIRLQVYGALAAGCRSIKYWMRTPLDDTGPGATERQLAITQLNLEIELLEDWIATGRVEGHVPFTVEDTRRTRTATSVAQDFFRRSRSNESKRGALDVLLGTGRDGNPMNGELQATRIRTEMGLLLLPTWYRNNAQFVPDQMYARNAVLIVPAQETASAWLVTTTGLKNLKAERGLGGLQITLPEFDQTAAIILTSNGQIVAELDRRARAMAQISANVSVKLAKSKLARVQSVDAELQSLGVGRPESAQLLIHASSWLQRADQAQRTGDHDRARRESETAMRFLRMVQHGHWNYAVTQLTAPLSSPHTACFQTLPDHWRMMQALGRSVESSDQNLLPSGDFEDAGLTSRGGWEYYPTRFEGLAASAELFSHARSGDYCLRLLATPIPGRNPPDVVNDNLVVVRTPPIDAPAGRVMHVSGWVRIPSPIVGSIDGAMVYDSVLDRPGAIQWNQTGDWQRFELIREATGLQPFSLTFALNGMGEMQVDDLQIIAYNPPQPEADVATPQPKSTDRDPRRLLDYLPGINRLRRSRE